MDLQAGSKVGQYTLETYLGGGSFGAVWRGHSESGQRVALKLLTGALSTADTARLRADVEMLAAAAVASRSEHVVKMLGGGNEPLPYIVMEYIDGQDLASLISDGGVLPVARTIDVGVAIMDALSALNEAGIFHRDIKPANVMIDSKGVIKLADFGIAKIVGYESITMTGQAAMTMAYAAPEIWDEDSPFGRPSHRSDLYAAGIVLYQCLTGAPPFRGNYGALYKAHAERQPDLALLPAATPPSLRLLIGRCMEKRQEDRPSNAEECMLILKRASVEMQERSGGLPAHEPSHFGPWRRESPHETQPWAWHCRHETTDEAATVEMHFASSLEYGAQLRRAVEANPELAPLGAERLIATNRMLLGPDEAWQAAPKDPFEFWVAREDASPKATSSISLAALKAGIVALSGLLTAAEAAKVPLALKRGLSLSAAGVVYVARPGLVQTSGSVSERALAALKAMPLQPDARDLVTDAASFEDLVRRSRSGEAPTELAGDRTAFRQTTVLASPPRPARQANDAARAVYKPVGIYLRELGRTGARAEYELMLTNPGPGSRRVEMAALSWEDQLKVDLAPEATLAAGETVAFQVLVSARKRRVFGGTRRTGFRIEASDGGSGGRRPPVSVDGDFEDQPSKAPLLAGGGVLGLGAVAVFAAVALANGGGKGAPAVLVTSTPRARATFTRQATATKVPPTATLVPSTATSVPPTPTSPPATATEKPAATATAAPATATPAPAATATAVPPSPTPAADSFAPKPGTYNVNKVLGTDQGVQLTLTSIQVLADGKLTANFSYLNTGSVYATATLGCQTSTPASSITQAGGATLKSVDSFCDHNQGATFNVPKGGTHAEWTTFQGSNLDSRQPISIDVGGWSTVDGIYLR